MKWKKIAVIGAVSFSLAIGAACYAAGGEGSIRAYQNRHIKLIIDSKAWTPQNSDGLIAAPVILGGTSYLPTRGIVELLGGKVEWIEATKTIAITTASGSKTPVPADERDQLIANKINEVKEKLKLGSTKEEVDALFEEKYETAHNNGDLEIGDSFGKYVFFRESGYHRDDIPDHVVDEEGLKAKKIGATLFIGWKENKLLFYSISYVNPKDQEVYLYFKDSRGTSDNPVSFNSGGAENTEVYLNHEFKFTLNGKAWVPQDSDGAAAAPVIVDGTSYVPTKAIVEALGGQVEWIDATKTIVITSAK